MSFELKNYQEKKSLYVWYLAIMIADTHFSVTYAFCHAKQSL